MKIFAAGIASETNTFSAEFTGREDFLVQRGRDVLKGQIDYPSQDLSAVWGKLAGERGDTFHFSLMAWAQPSGITVRSAYEELRDELLEDLRNALPVDVVLLNLHGAMVAQGYEDCEEDMIRRVREIAGRGAVIGVELDLHCHLSEAKLAAADIVVIYKEYPHDDIHDRARELFQLATATKLGKIHPTSCLFDCRMIGFYPTTRQPLRRFVDTMKAAERHSGVLSISFGHGFQFGDVPHGGAKMLVVTDDDPALAKQLAREFGMRVYGMRHEIGFETISLALDDALSKAMASQRPPIVVADQSDNPGGGAPSDSTFALRWLIDHKVENVGLAILYDPEVVRIAKKADVGAKLQVRLGGKLSPASGEPVDLEATLLAIRHNYMHAFPQQGGDPWWMPCGDVVALRCRGIDIVVSSVRCQCFSPSIFVDLGIEPTSRHILVVKSVQHFHKAFAPIAGEVIYMAAPGAVAPDPRQITYRRMDTRRLYPWSKSPLGD
jgi:microcystin degradation protein MlrC